MERIYGEQSFKEDRKSNKMDMLGDELSELIFVIICIANQCGIDLENAIQENLKKKTERDTFQIKS